MLWPVTIRHRCWILGPPGSTLPPESIWEDRWVLFTGGPDLGPSVLFWGLVIVLILLSIGLGRSRLTPLKTRDWLFLGLGLSQAGIWVWLLVTGWLFALGLRVRLDGGAATLAVQSDVD